MGAPRLLILGLFRQRLLGGAAPALAQGWRTALARLCSALAPGTDTSAALVDLDDTEALGAATAQAARADAVALVALTACSTELLEPFIHASTRSPFVLLAPRPPASWDAGYDLKEHIAGSGQVGAAMIASLLARHGARFVTHVPDPALAPTRALVGLLQAAAAAGRLRRLRVLRIEGPHRGYSHMELPIASPDHGWGMEVDEIRLSELFPSAPASGGVLSLLPGFDPHDDALASELELAAAIQRHCRDREYDAVAINSSRFHELTQPPARPVLGKVALSAVGAEGMACSDTGDVLAAVLLFIAKRIAGAALYCELNASSGSDRWHCSTTGEADLAWQSLGRAAQARLERGADLFGDAWTVNANVGSGPATLIGIAAVPGSHRRAPLRLVAVEGTAAPLENLALPRAAFSFRVPGDDADALLARWLDAGPSHHACLVHGHVAASLQAIAQLTGAELVFP